MSQQYSLRWNNHQPNFISMFTTLLNTQTLVDVTLAADGKQLLAHKLVLSACSTYFQSLFVDNPSPHPIVILKDVTYADLRTMVDFMYCGQVNVTEEQLPKVLDTAKLLKIKGLTEMPESTSLTRSQGTSEQLGESDRQSPSSPSGRHKKRRKSSSTSLSMVEETSKVDVEAVTMSSLPQQRRMREYHEIRTIDNSQQVEEAPENENINVQPLPMETPTPVIGEQWTMMDTSYNRYQNSCMSAGVLQPDAGMYMNNVNSQIESDVGYGQPFNVAGPPPGSSNVDVKPIPQVQRVVKRRRMANPQAEENFQRALEAVRFGGIGFCKAARMFGVNNRTLWLEYKKRGYPNNRPSIKSRIKREHTSPPPEQKEPQQNDHRHLHLLTPAPQLQMSSSFLENVTPPHGGFPLAHSTPLNILGVNYSMQ